MNEIHAEAHGVTAASVRHVIAKLIFLLIALNRKRRDRGSELIVAEGIAAGGGQKVRCEGKVERFADRRITYLGVMKPACRQR